MHVGMSNQYNGIHPTIKYKYKDYNVGTFYNSEKNISSYISRSNNLNDKLKIEYGLVTGYKASVLPFFRLKYSDYFIAPGIEGDRIGILMGKELKF